MASEAGDEIIEYRIEVWQDATAEQKALFVAWMRGEANL
jgi:hypothetical protein